LGEDVGVDVGGGARGGDVEVGVGGGRGVEALHWALGVGAARVGMSGGVGWGHGQVEGNGWAHLSWRRRW